MITCSSKSQPKAFFTIIHNGTIYITGNGETHTIRNVNWNAAGYYTCVASNILGRNPSNSKFLNVKGKASFKDISSFSVYFTQHLRVNLVLCGETSQAILRTLNSPVLPPPPPPNLIT